MITYRKIGNKEFCSDCTCDASVGAAEADSTFRFVKEVTGAGREAAAVEFGGRTGVEREKLSVAWSPPNVAAAVTIVLGFTVDGVGSSEGIGEDVGIDKTGIISGGSEATGSWG